MAAALGTGGEHDAALSALREHLAARSGRAVVDLPGDGPDDGGPGVLVHVLALRPAPATGPPSRVVTTADVRLDVLVTAVGGTPGERAALVTDLALDLVADGTWPLRPDGPEAGTWASLGLAVRPGLVVEVPVRRRLDRPPAPPVRRLRLSAGPVHRLHGRVVAEDGTPLAGADVLVLPAGPRTRTDPGGRFALTAATPTAVRALRVRVRARDAVVVLALPVVEGGVLEDAVVPGLAPS